MTTPVCSDRDQAKTGAHPKDEPHGDARAEWEQRIDRRTDGPSGADQRMTLPAPTGVRAVGAVGHIRVGWDRAPDAAGYVIERTEGPDGRPVVLDHGGSDVKAVSTHEFADTGVSDEVEYHYRIGAVAGAEYPASAWSEPVSARSLGGPAGPIKVGIDASKVIAPLSRVWHMVGSERLSQLRLGGEEQWIGTEFAAALQQAHDDLGVTFVRAHAILHDDNHVVHRDDAGKLQYHFDGVDAIYDQLLDLGGDAV